MFRLIALTAALAMLPVAASAIEMQTNFHYGERVGFPPMEVPTAIYGGWGTPGWNCNAMGKVPVQPGLPAMYPSGCTYGSGCNYCDSAWAGYQQKAFHKRVNTRWYYGNHRPMPPGGPGPVDGMSDDYYQGQPVSVENGTTSVIQQPSEAPLQTAPTPATPNDPKPAETRQPPRTTSRPFKTMLQRSNAG
jgi:hypothetical protein